MRTNNAKVRSVIVSIYFILVVLAIIFSTLLTSFSEDFDNLAVLILLSLLIFTLLFIITYHVSRYFEYDSDGEQVIILNKGLLLSDHFNYREHRIEFEKSKLKGFRFNNYIIYKSLTIYLESKSKRKRSETFNVSLVSKKKRRYIRQSLSKIVKNNKKQTQLHG